jgi:hypothetical protein
MGNDDEITAIYNELHEQLRIPPETEEMMAEKDGERVTVLFSGLLLKLGSAIRRLGELNIGYLNEIHVRYAVAVLGEIDDDTDDDAVARLAKALRPKATELSHRIARAVDEHGGAPRSPEKLRDFEGTFDGREMLLLDAVFLECLQSTGEVGEDAADHGAEKAQERWRNFRENAPPTYSAVEKLLHLWYSPDAQGADSDDLQGGLADVEHVEAIGSDPMVVEFIRPYDKWDPGDTAEFTNAGIVRSLCGMKEDHADDNKPFAKHVDGPHPDQVVPPPWHALGGPSPERSSDVGEDSTASISLRQMSVPRSVFYLTRAVWRDQVREDWKRLRNNRPAVAIGDHESVEQMMFEEGRRIRKPDGPQQALELWNQADELVAETPILPEQQLARVVEQGAEEFRSITGVRLLVHVIRTTHLQFYRKADDPRAIDVEGGIEALTQKIGDSAGNRARVKRILNAGADFTPSDMEGKGLWTWRHPADTAPGKRSHVRIIVGDDLSPHAVFNRPKGRRRLVPIVEIAPLVAPGRYYGPQAAFQQAVVRKIVDRRKYIPERGGAPLSLRDDLWPIADRLGLPQSTMERTLDRWTSDGDDGPKFLELVEGRIEGEAVYHLADNSKYELERRFVDDGARRTKRAREAGKASAEKRKNR